MAKKSAASNTPTKRKGVTAVTSQTSVTATDSSSTAEDANLDAEPSISQRERVPKINTSSLVELKNTCDDVVKEFFARPGAFTRSHVHEDVRLVLGWSAVLVALATGYHGYVKSFEESKALVTVGVLIYMLLSTLMTIYITYFEKQIIFEGKRRTFAARISTERLSVSSTAASSPRHSTGILPFPFSLMAPATAKPSSASAVTATKDASPKRQVAPYPSYTLSLDYVHSSNHGKSLIHQANASTTWCFGEFFDVEGRLAKSALERELSKLLAEAVGK